MDILALPINSLLKQYKLSIFKTLPLFKNASHRLTLPVSKKFSDKNFAALLCIFSHSSWRAVLKGSKMNIHSVGMDTLDQCLIHLPFPSHLGGKSIISIKRIQAFYLPTNTCITDMFFSSQVLSNCDVKVFNTLYIFKHSSLSGICSMDLFYLFPCKSHQVTFDRLEL